MFRKSSFLRNRKRQTESKIEYCETCGYTECICTIKKEIEWDGDPINEGQFIF